MKELFYKLLAQLRAMTLYNQTAHWTVKNTVFMADHMLFERLYNEVNAEIDIVAEKAIGLTGGDTVNLPMSLKMIYEKVKTLPSNCPENVDCFKASLSLEQEFISLCSMADKLPDASLGFRNLVADLADRSEGRCYLIKQRIPAPKV
jgi:DNA-binding ferritin-like protein